MTGAISPSRHAGCTIIVTGASRGIGRAIAERLSAEGARLVLTGGPGEEALLMAVAGECGEALALAGDLADPDLPGRLVEAALERFGGVDGIVNNAFAEEVGSVEAVSLEGWDRTLRVTLTAPMLLAKAALPALRSSGHGAIVNIASQRAFASGHAAAAYESAKGGLVTLTRSLAVDYGPEGIRANCLSPGLIFSERVQQWLAAGPRRAEAMGAAIALRRPGLPSEIASVVAFMLSEEAAYINGAVIPVDGGALAGLPENAALALTGGA